MIQDLYKQKKSLELNWEQEHLKEGRYTLEMTKIDHAVDSAENVEKAILDKLGEKSITWEYLGDSYHTGSNRITYEEVINNDTRPIQTKKVLGVEVATGASG